MTEEILLDLETNLSECQGLAKTIDEAGFIWHMGRLSELYRSIKFEEALVKAQDGLSQAGYEKAKQTLLKDLSGVEIGGVDMSQDGNVLDEFGDVYKEVGNAKDIRMTQAIDFGLPGLDNKLLGVRRGELLIIAAWTGAGKTSLCVNTAVYSSCVQRRNVVYVTTETIRSPLRRRIYARMSKLPVFANGGYIPISSQAMKSGELTPDMKKTMDAMKGWREATDLGVLEVVQAPAYPTCAWLRGKLLQLESQYPIDLVIMDDIRSLVPPVRRRQEYEELTLIVRDMKAIARTHANRGVPVISPHHINREAYKKMIESAGTARGFDMSGLAGSSEVEKRADIIIGLWYDANQDPHSVRGDLLKVRDGQAGDLVNLGVQWEYQYFYTQESGHGFVPE
jgi:replicative DNA helicase